MPGPMVSRGPATEKVMVSKVTIAKLVRYIAYEKIKLFVAIAFAIAWVCYNVWGPRMLGQATTQQFDGLAAGSLFLTNARQLHLRRSFCHEVIHAGFRRNGCGSQGIVPVTMTVRMPMARSRAKRSLMPPLTMSFR